MRSVISFALGLIVTGMLSCSKPFPEGEFLTLLLIQGPTDNNKYIFVTPGGHNADFAAGFANGIAGADAFCAQAKAASFASLPGTSTDYKALIVDDSNRVASTTANIGDGQVNWVLKPNTSYYLSNQTLLFTTNANALFVFGSLTTAFSPDAGIRWWTGFSNAVAWGTAAFPCSDWGDATGGFVRAGTSQAVDYTSLSLNNISCTLTTPRLLCVRQ